MGKGAIRFPATGRRSAAASQQQQQQNNIFFFCHSRLPEDLRKPGGQRITASPVPPRGASHAPCIRFKQQQRKKIIILETLRPPSCGLGPRTTHHPQPQPAPPGSPAGRLLASPAVEGGGGSGGFEGRKKPQPLPHRTAPHSTEAVGAL